MADPTYKGHPSFTGNPDAVTVDQFNQYPDITQLEDTIDANTAQPSAEVATMVAKWYVHKMSFCFFQVLRISIIVIVCTLYSVAIIVKIIFIRSFYLWLYSL